MQCPVFHKNEGLVDRVLRVVAGSVLVAVSASTLTGGMQTVGFILGGALLVTGAVGYCGLYSLLHISTISKKK